MAHLPHHHDRRYPRLLYVGCVPFAILHGSLTFSSVVHHQDCSGYVNCCSWVVLEVAATYMSDNPEYLDWNGRRTVQCKLAVLANLSLTYVCANACAFSCA